VHLSLMEMNRDEQVAGVVDGRVDLGFVRDYQRPLLDGGLVATQLLEEPLVVAIREDHPLAASGRPLTIPEIADLPFVLYHAALGAGFNDHLASLFRRHGREFRVAQEVGGLASLLGLVAAGLGVSVIVRSLAALHADHMVYRPLDEPDVMTRLWLVHRERLSPAGRNFVELVTGAP
jgi:DNA-binding transcriptional LysR family regulator